MTEDELVAALSAKARHELGRAPLRGGVPIAPPAPMSAVSVAQADLGFTLPPLLVRVYTDVANGGIGPGYGLLSLVGRAPDQSLCATYHLFRKGGQESEWPERLLPLWDWGCASWSCVDVPTAEGDIVTQDEAGATLTSFNVRTWLEAWLTGVDLRKEIYEDKVATILNPFTRRPVETKIRGTAKGTRWRAS